jgi:hypothetical protein
MGSGWPYSSLMEIFNLFNGETDQGPTEPVPPGYRCRAARIGPTLGASLLGMSVYDVPPGEAFAPSTSSGPMRNG